MIKFRHPFSKVASFALVAALSGASLLFLFAVKHQRARAQDGYGKPIENVASKQVAGVFASSGNTFEGKEGGVFIIKKGNGNGTISGFDAGKNHFLRIQGYGFSQVSDVRPLMKQDGDAVVVSLPDGAIVRIANTKLSAIPDTCFQLELDRKNLVETFADDFESLRWDSQNQVPGRLTGGIWRTNYGWGPPTAEASRSLTAEEQVYTDPGFRGTRDAPFGVNPFRITNGILEIVGDKASDEMLPHIWGRKYTSGLITSKGSFSQLYGVFEMRAKLPKGRGYFPAFWLLPSDSSWPPELDVFEILGHTPTILYSTFHSNHLDRHTSITSNTTVPDLSADFHQFALEWQKDELRWYFDGVEVARTATPKDMSKPMYMLANLSIGASWPGSPDASTVFPGVFAIDWIRAYKHGTVSGG